MPNDAPPHPLPPTSEAAAAAQLQIDISRLGPADRDAWRRWLEEVADLPVEEQFRQLEEVQRDADAEASLREFELDPENYQNCLGRPGQLEILLKNLLRANSRPTSELPLLFPDYGCMNVIQQRLGHQQSIMTKLVNDTKAGFRVIKLIQTPCMSHQFLVDLMIRLSPEFKKGLRLLLGASIVQVQRVVMELRGSMREARELGGRLLPYFLSEHDDRLTDHEKVEWSVDIVTGRSTLAVMSANANNRGMGQELAWADDSRLAPSSFETMFQGLFDARDECSHFWVHLKEINESLIVRRSLRALLMPTDAWFERALTRPDPMALFDEDAFVKEYTVTRANKAARAATEKGKRTANKTAAEAARLRFERATWASAGTADAEVMEAAKKSADSPSSAAAATVLSAEEKAEGALVAQKLQQQMDRLKAEYPQSGKAMQEVAQMKKKARAVIDARISVEPVKSDGKKKFKPYSSKIPRLNARYSSGGVASSSVKSVESSIEKKTPNKAVPSASSSPDLGARPYAAGPVGAIPHAVPPTVTPSSTPTTGAAPASRADAHHDAAVSVGAEASSSHTPSTAAPSYLHPLASGTTTSSRPPSSSSDGLAHSAVAPSSRTVASLSRPVDNAVASSSRTPGVSFALPSVSKPNLSASTSAQIEAPASSSSSHESSALKSAARETAGTKRLGELEEPAEEAKRLKRPRTTAASGDEHLTSNEAGSSHPQKSTSPSYAPLDKRKQRAAEPDTSEADIDSNEETGEDVDTSQDVDTSPTGGQGKQIKRQSHHFFSPAEDAFILKERAKNPPTSYTTISVLLGQMSGARARQGSVVSARHKRLQDGRPVDAPRRNFTPDEDATIRRLRGEGKYWKDIAQALGRSGDRTRARALNVLGLK